MELTIKAEQDIFAVHQIVQEAFENMQGTLASRKSGSIKGDPHTIKKNA